MPPRVLVTGGAGFIGSHLCESLIKDDFSVIALDNMSNANLENVRGLIKFRNFRLVNGDIRDYSLMRDITRGVDVLFHLAAQIHIDRSILYPEITFDINAGGTLNVLKAARENNVGRIIFASTSEVYGTALAPAISEEHPLNPASPYAASKVAADRLCYSYFFTYGMNVTVVRNFNTYGPRQMDYGYASAIPKFIKRVLADKPPIIYGNGEQSRDYMYVDDAVSAYRAVMQHEDLAGETINFGTGRDIKIKDLANLIIYLCNKKESLKLSFVNERPGEVSRLCADISKADKRLGWTPKHDIRTGVEKLITWYRDYQDEPWVDNTMLSFDNFKPDK